MSLFQNAYGNFLGGALPYYQSMPGIITPYGTLLKPGGRIAAYVRSTGAQDGEDHFATSGMLVTTINAGLNRCRAGQNDIVYVLPGHTETFASTGSIFGTSLVAGAQILGVGAPGATNNPVINLTHAGASVALSSANVTLSGLNIVGGVATATASIVITGAGVNLAGNFLNFSGFALGANSPIAVTGAANCAIVGNNIVADCTSTMIAITAAASTNFLVAGNIARQTQATSGGGFSSTASTTGISGMYCNNYFKTAVTSTAGAGVIVIGANTLTTVGNVENWANDETAAAALVVTGA
jgi:hypothetical protein